ncbi:MAG TPA: substrate-binding domain-containing protein [Solirubrobacteraceae bacterium]|jgi:ABC-type phosphate transport system substrate-binding protein|nr:substrate-binding domain-containing protein [Solirubrobacteraceae bacterium]
MTFLSARRLVAACAVSAAAVAAVAAPGAASATDLGTQCSGSNISGLGSSFQAPAQFIWTGTKGGKGFNVSTSTLGCNGTQGSTGKPTVTYAQGEAEKGSGACLKDFGAGATPKYNLFPFCGTDEAPNPTVKTEIESHAAAGVAANALETIPVLQGAVAVIVHLPAGCKASSEVVVGLKKIKLGRLVFDNTTVEKIYNGSIKTWKEAVEAQGAEHGSDALTCKVPAEAEATIHPVVRADKSGTTHIFKAYLGQVNTNKIPMEEFNEPQGKGKPCGAILPAGEEKTWNAVSEGCENQRWPQGIEASKIRPTETGNPGVIHTVASTESSLSYADLAAARELESFSKKGQGGENSKGSETKQGEQNVRFWAEIQDSETGVTPVKYADPASNGDIEKLGQSNCAGTVYAAKVGEKFPPKNTRETWFAVKAELTQKKYNICGLTYDLAVRQYNFFMSPLGATEEESKNAATSVENYLKWTLSAKTEGGGLEIKNHDYEKLSGTVLEEAEDGVEEIRNVENSPQL